METGNGIYIQQNELSREVKYLLRHYKEQHDLDVISETLIALTGLPLSTLIKWAKETEAQEED